VPRQGGAGGGRRARQAALQKRLDGSPKTPGRLEHHLVPGVVRFYNTNSLTRLVEDQGLTVVECKVEPGRVSVLARS